MDSELSAGSTTGRKGNRLILDSRGLIANFLSPFLEQKEHAGIYRVDSGTVFARLWMTKDEQEVLLKLRSLRTDPNPPQEWISLSLEKEVLNKRVRTGGLPPGYIDQ